MRKESLPSLAGKARHPSATSNHSQKSFPPDSARSLKSINSAGCVGTTSTKLPPINLFRKLSKLALSAEGTKPKNRRISHPFPVTSWKSQQDENEATSGSRWKKLRSTKSHPELQNKDSAKAGDNVWRMTMILSKAKRKLSESGEKVLKKRVSLRDFLTVAALKRSDTEKRKLIRELKRRALQQKVRFYKIYAIWKWFLPHIRKVYVKKKKDLNKLCEKYRLMSACADMARRFSPSLNFLHIEESFCGNRRGGLLVRASASWGGGRGFDPRWRQPKVLKAVRSGFSPWHSGLWE